MTKDYAKKTRRTRSYPSQRTKAASPLIPAWIWLFLGVFLGIGLAIFVFWKWNKTVVQQPPSQTITITDNHGAPIIDNSLQEEEEKSRFDFYTLLPNLKVDLPDVATPPTVRKPQKDNKTPPTPGLAFIIQAGSFKTHDQAEHLKAQLALSGFESQIQTVNIQPDETWFRVYIGPFHSKDDALVTQQNLERNHAFNSLILKIRV